MKARFGGSSIKPALAAATLLGSAGLVVDHDSDAGDLAQLLLDGVEIAAMFDARAGGKIRRLNASPARR